MRKKFEIQFELGATPVEKIALPLDSRDELPAVLMGLQHIHMTPELNAKVFDILDKKILTSPNPLMGRPGMSHWEILVFGAIRLARDIDYDQLRHIANYDALVRQFVGISDFTKNLKKYSLQTLKDNIGLLDENTFRQINELVAKAIHDLNPGKNLHVKIDTYVLETNVHFPTDLNLLYDAGRKRLDLISHIITDAKVSAGWRKLDDWHRRFKEAYHQAAKRTLGAGRHTAAGFEAAQQYLTLAEDLTKKLKSTKERIRELAELSARNTIRFNGLQYFEHHLDTHIVLVRRRLIFDETIAHAEKMFSLFEPHTEWIKKGKAGNKVELGLRMAIATDQYGTILGHRILEKEPEVNMAIPFVQELVATYHNIDSVSFDKGFWSPDNYRQLSQLVTHVILPKKGKLNQAEYERQHTRQFKALRNQHAAVESDINCLEHHGLNRCPDKGLVHFKNYAALGIVAYNLHRLGNILLARAREQLSKNMALHKAA